MPKSWCVERGCQTFGYDESAMQKNVKKKKKKCWFLTTVTDMLMHGGTYESLS